MTPLFNLDYKSIKDDAWYTSGVVLEDNDRRLRVKLQDFVDSTFDEVFTVKEFQNLDDVSKFVRRFRLVSVAVEDNECAKVTENMTVCASFHGDDGSLRYFDAVVDTVHYKEHTPEKCICNYVLHWQHGPAVGNLTAATLEDIYLIKSGPIDSSVAKFTKFVKEKLKGGSSEFTLIPKMPFLSPRTSSNETMSKSHKSQEFGTAGHSSHDGSVEGSERFGAQFSDDDRDMGGVKQTGSHHYIILENLEKDLCPVLMTAFIHEQTSITAQAYVFPCLSKEIYARGAIVADSRPNLTKIYKFISNPNHFIISCSGRPWVIAEDILRTGSFNTNLRELRPKSENYNTRELKVVHLGSEEYTKAKKLKDQYTEYRNHLNGLVRSLDKGEKKILQPCSVN